MEKKHVGSTTNLAGVAIAQRCEETLFGRRSSENVTCLWNKSSTPAPENIIEANSLLSGIGFEGGGVNGSSRPSIMKLQPSPETFCHLTHGEKVAYGTLVHYSWKPTKRKNWTVLRFYQQIGMPTTLKEMHLENATTKIFSKVGQQATIEGEIHSPNAI